MRTLSILLTAITLGTAPHPVLAQPYDEGFDRPPPRARQRPPERARVGFNCDAVQSGLSGPQPYSCPLPSPRPLGARCFCDMPVASFSQPQTAVGRVVP